MVQVVGWKATKEQFTFDPSHVLPSGMKLLNLSNGGTQQRERVKKIEALFRVSDPKLIKIKGGDAYKPSRDALTGIGPTACTYPPGATGVDSEDTMPENSDKGHLIADAFDGPATPDNLVPMYQGFNRSTWKIKVENAFRTYCEKHYPCSAAMVIDIAYSLFGDPRVPSSFTVTFTKYAPDFPQQIGFQKKLPAKEHRHFPGLFFFGGSDMETTGQLLHTAPVLTDRATAVVSDTSVDDIFKLAKALRGTWSLANAMVAKEDWRLERTKEAQPHTFDLPPWFDRPYAALDYLLLTGGLDGYIKTSSQKDAIWKKKFAPWQKRLILACNLLLHRKDVFVSDDPLDHAHDIGAPQEPYAYPHGLGRYHGFIKRSGTTGLPRGALFPGVTQWSPQIDHIVAQAGKGLACFSNARVTSARWNRDKSDGDSSVPFTVSHMGISFLGGGDTLVAESSDEESDPYE